MKNDGGSVFPKDDYTYLASCGGHPGRYEKSGQQGGISLREYYVAKLVPLVFEKVMENTGPIGDATNIDTRKTTIARWSIALSDALIEELNKEKSE